MTITSLDTIVRNMLLKHRYGLQYYLDFLLYAAECLKILTLDDLRVINSKIFTIDQTDCTIPIPNGASYILGVYIQIGER